MSFKLVDGLNDCSNAQYHMDRTYISSSGLKVAYKDIAEFDRQYNQNIKPVFGNENALSEGSLTHAEILEPHNVKHDFVFYNGLRKAGADFQAFKDALSPADAKKTIISKPQKLRVDSYIKAYKRRPEAVALITNGFAEQTICGELLGVKIKTRFDYINVELGEIYDVKTTADSAELEAFKETVKKYSYQLSAALYLEMAEQYYGKPFVFKFIVISKQEPQECHVYRLSDKSRSEGLSMIKIACEKITFARKNNIWTEQKNLSNSHSNDSINVSGYEILDV